MRNSMFCVTVVLEISQNGRILCTLGGLGRYIGRLSTDISVDYRPIYRSTVGRLSVDYRSTIGRLSVDYRSTIGRYSVDISVDSRPTDMSTDIVLVHRYSTDT